ncbi:hypothetical protein LINPERHAP2_LOCUS24260 [Linum perenne]
MIDGLLSSRNLESSIFTSLNQIIVRFCCALIIRCTRPILNLFGFYLLGSLILVSSLC